MATATKVVGGKKLESLKKTSNSESKANKFDTLFRDEKDFDELPKIISYNDGNETQLTISLSLSNICNQNEKYKNVIYILRNILDKLLEGDGYHKYGNEELGECETQGLLKDLDLAILNYSNINSIALELVQTIANTL